MYKKMLKCIINFIHRKPYVFSSRSSILLHSLEMKLLKTSTATGPFNLHKTHNIGAVSVLNRVA